MKKYKSIAFLLVVASLMTSITGCKKDDSDKKKDTDETESSRRNIEISVDDTQQTVATETTLAVPAETEPIDDPFYDVDGILQLRVKTSGKSYYDDANNYIGSLSYQALMLSDTYAQTYPELNQALVSYDETMTDYMEQYAIDEGAHSQYWHYSVSTSLRRAGDGVLSFVEIRNNSNDSEGATYITNNYDIESGNQITLEQVADVDLITSYIAGLNAEFTLDVEKFVIDPEGITFIDGDDYTLNPDTLFVPFNETNLFTGTYGAVNEENGYVVEADNIGSYVDADNDGVYEKVLVNAIEGDDYGFYAMDIAVGGDDYTFEGFFAFSLSSRVINANGKNYIYVSLSAENDYVTTQIFEIDPVSLVNVTESDYRVYGIYHDGDEIINYIEPSDYSVRNWHSYYIDVMSDPCNFYMARRFNICSTYLASVPCRVGDNGMPEVLLHEYILAMPIVMEANIDIPGNLVDGSDYIISAGTRMLLTRTDGDSRIGFELDDGTSVYVSVQPDSDRFGYLVAGVNCETALNGVMYAG